MPRACLYITGHGLGHASRVQAVAEALLDDPAWIIELRTTAPAEVFAWLLGERCLLTIPPAGLDPGVVQSDSFHHDLGATFDVWRTLLDRREALIAAEVAHLTAAGTDLVLADVSPLACAAGRRAHLPTLAMGNFTWDWILEDYLPREPRFAEVIDEVRALYSAADLYLRLPMSHPTPSFRRQQELPLVARRAHRERAEVRRLIGVSDDETVVLLSFGGFGVDRLEIDAVARYSGVRCLWDRGPARPPLLLSTRGSDLHYTDLIRAADVVLTKPGYSIIAEAVAQRTLLVYAPRAGFRENELLVDYLERFWPSRAVSVESLADGSWVEPALQLVRSAPPLPRIATDGAEHAAAIIRDHAR